MPVHIGGYTLLYILHTGLRVVEAPAPTRADGEKPTQTYKAKSGDMSQALMDLQMLRNPFQEQYEVIVQRRKEELVICGKTQYNNLDHIMRSAA